MEAIILSKDQYAELVARLDEITTCLSPLKGWTAIVNQFSHSKFRNYDENKTTVYT